MTHHNKSDFSKAKAERDAWFKSRIDDCKDFSVSEMIDRLRVPGMVPNGIWLSGPCPNCGGKDRFNINLRDKGFFCRHDCGFKGGDMLALAQQVMNLDLESTLKKLFGAGPIEIDAEEMERRRKRREESDKKTSEDADRYRRNAIAQAKTLWSKGVRPEGTPVEDYLAIRGVAAAMPRMGRCLRYHPDLPYMHKIDGEWVELHRGPAMLAGIQAPNGYLVCTHRTWIDVTKPDGKAVIMKGGEPFLDAKGKPLKVKKTIGSTKGGAIRLCTPSGADTLICGEGIETTATAMLAEPIPNAAYWALVDLGNMAGKMQRVSGKRHSGLPDMGDLDAFVPPPWVKHEIYIMDGDSEPKMTRAKLECGLRRAMAVRPGLTAQIVHPGEGIDLNDLLKKGKC